MNGTGFVLTLTITFTTMEIVVFKMLFIVSYSLVTVSLQFGKHVYVRHHQHGWYGAQKHCRDHFIDLSPISTGRVERKLKNATTGQVEGEFWIGLYKDGTQWKWSGGGNATYTQWDDDEPDDNTFEVAGGVCWHHCTQWTRWHNVGPSMHLPFFCFNLIVMKHKKTWYQALQHCRQAHTTLTSLSSETEHLLALSEIQHDHITERVWIGLRFLGDRWLWVDGDPLVYQAWPQGDEDHQCPIWKRCGALTKEGLWESWDCQDELHFICY